MEPFIASLRAESCRAVYFARASGGLAHRVVGAGRTAQSMAIVGQCVLADWAGGECVWCAVAKLAACAFECLSLSV